MATLSPKNPLSVTPFRRMFSKKGTLREFQEICVAFWRCWAPKISVMGAPMQNVKVTVEGIGDAATAPPGSGIIVLSDPFCIAPVIIDNPQLLDLQPMWANCPTLDNLA